MISEEAKNDDGLVQEAVIEKFVKYFKSIFHRKCWYFSLLGVQFFLTKKFLNNKFTWYGKSVIQYYSWSHKDRHDKELGFKSEIGENLVWRLIF